MTWVIRAPHLPEFLREASVNWDHSWAMQFPVWSPVAELHRIPVVRVAQEQEQVRRVVAEYWQDKLVSSVRSWATPSQELLQDN